jgi:hypothetical protein
VLSVLLSTRIKADLAMAAASTLVRAGMGTVARMRAASWQDRVDALRYSITIFSVHPEAIGARQAVHGAQPRRL